MKQESDKAKFSTIQPEGYFACNIYLVLTL